MNPTANKSDFEDLTTNLRDLAYSYLEKYSPSKQQLKIYLLKKYLTKIKGTKSKKEVTEAVIAEKAIPGSGKAKLTMMTSNENIPEQARRYITIRASRIFHDRTLGANALHRFSRQDELVALSILKQAEASVADHNIFNSYDQFTTVARSRSYKLID